MGPELKHAGLTVASRAQPRRSHKPSLAFLRAGGGVSFVRAISAVEEARRILGADLFPKKNRSGEMRVQIKALKPYVTHWFHLWRIHSD